MILRFRGLAGRVLRFLLPSATPRQRAPELPPAGSVPGSAAQRAEPAELSTMVAPPSPQAPPSRAPRSDLAVVIGLDFGTYSTKVVLRRRGEQQGTVVRVEPPVEGYPTFASPSLVRVSDDAISFGGEALAGRLGALFSSLKLDLLGGFNDVHQDWPTPDLLAALYMSWVLRRVKAYIDARYGEEGAKVLLNVAAPMDHYESAALKSRYLRIVRAAWESVYGAEPVGVEQGLSLADAVHRFAPWLAEGTVPDPTVRAYEVLPETIAPIVSLSRDPRMDPGMYLIVDMGAGTTELSIDYVEAPGGDQNVLCYYDEWVRLGAEQLQNPSVAEDGDHLIREFLRAVRRTWGEGYEKDARNHAARHRWKQLSILLAGGGTFRSDVLTTIRSNRRAVMHAFAPEDVTYSVLRHAPCDIDFGPGEGPNPPDASLLAVANGLAFPRMQWPVVYPPSDVPDLEGTPQRERGDPLWYLER